MKRRFLLGVLVSVGMAAILGVVLIFYGGQWEGGGEEVWKGLATVMGTAGASLGCYLMVDPLEKKRHVVVARMGMVTAWMGCLGLIAGMWFGQVVADWLYAHGYSRGDLVGAVVFTSWAVPVYLVLAVLLLMPRLRAAGRWAQVITVGMMTAWLVAELTWMWAGLWREGPRRLDLLWEGLEKLTDALMVLIVGGVVATPILARFYGIKTDEEMEEVASLITVVCPRCQVRQEVRMGDGKCNGCGLRFKIEAEEPRCATCGYRLHGLTRAVCPECGSGFDEAWLGKASDECATSRT